MPGSAIATMMPTPRRSGPEAVLFDLLTALMDSWTPCGIASPEISRMATMADLMLERGDYDGQLVWLRIRQALTELRAPPVGPAY
jgi:hypothetical protein